MVKIDLKDRKILYQLDINSRQSFSQIGKKVGISKNLVKYRIERLREKGVINNFYTVINAFNKLGFMAIRFHYVLQYTNPEIVNKIIKYLTDYKFSTLVGTTSGDFDISVMIHIRNINDLYKYYLEIENKFGYYFEKFSLSFYIKELHFRPSYLLPETFNISDREKYQTTGVGKKIEIDELDMNILKLLGPNARIPLTELAEKLKHSTATVKNRISRLIKQNVIIGFRTGIDLSKFGLNSYKIYLYITDYSIRKKLIDYIKYNPNLAYIDITAGESHIELDFHIETVSKLHEILYDVSKKFPNVIRNYSQIMVVNCHKILYYPIFD